MLLMNRFVLAVLAGVLAVAAIGCGGTETPGEETPSEDAVGELPVGDMDETGVPADGYGAALDCKPIPVLDVLQDPEIVVSLDGLTLHLRDRAGTYDKVFPIGPGEIDSKGKSYTPTSTQLPTGTFFTGRDTREVPDSGWGYYYPCRIWWTDADTGQRKPVFAGMPFIRLEGPPTAAYAIHGPVDGYTRPDGGILRRGYVSHGCVRMAGTDILEVYARIRGKARVPVRIQQEVERNTFGAMVDVSEKFIGQECAKDSDCNFAGGVCKANAYGRGFCSKACTSSCPDKTGFNATRCVADGTNGMCVISGDKRNNYCKGLPGLVQKTVKQRGKTTNVNVCMPGTAGQIGDPCRADSECADGICEASGLEGAPGFCSKACTSTCPGTAICTTIRNKGRCVETCWGQDACGAGLACEDGVPRLAGGTRRACVLGD